jgi:hypothetical protein
MGESAPDADAAAGDTRARSARAWPLAPSAASTSRLRMRPPGPEPVSSFSSIPASPAKRRASGEAGMRELGANEAEMGADAGAETGFFPFATGGGAFAGEALAAAVLAAAVLAAAVLAPGSVPLGARMDSGCRRRRLDFDAALSSRARPAARPTHARPASFSQRNVADSIVALSWNQKVHRGAPLKHEPVKQSSSSVTSRKRESRATSETMALDSRFRGNDEKRRGRCHLIGYPSTAAT